MKRGNKNKWAASLKNHKGVIITIFGAFLVFCGFLALVRPVNINNMGGTHSWLSGSTIKFVNNWLEDGAANLKFTNYEDPNSIEFETVDDREPYLSYPSGETFFVYLAARMAGKQQITISFLHKFQLIMFAIEAVLTSCFVYYFLTRTVKLKGEVIKIFFSIATALLWALLPVCSYYLSNVYYADQCVILWIIGFILIEYLFRTKNKTVSMKILRSIVIYTGFLIDYYFWFVALMFFVSEILEILIKIKKGERKKEIISVFLWYGIPVVAALLTYYIQLVMTPHWLEIMKDRFNERVVGGDKTMSWIFSTIFLNFSQAFSLGGETIYYLITVIMLTVLIGVVYLARKKETSILIKNPGLSVLFFGILATIMQIYFFKNHSAVHEFSMIKVGLIIALFPILMMVVFCRVFGIKNDESLKTFVVFLLSYLLIFIAAGIPISTRNYTNERLMAVDYSFEKMLAEKTNYEDVVFSYSEEIPINPPQSLAISRKRIYKIKDVEDIDIKVSKIKDQSKVVLVINKSVEIDKAMKEQQECLKKNGKIRHEDDKYILLDTNNYKMCSNKK